MSEEDNGPELSLLLCVKLINYATIARSVTSNEIPKGYNIFTLIKWNKFDFLMAPIELFIKRPTIEYTGNPRGEFLGDLQKRSELYVAQQNHTQLVEFHEKRHGPIVKLRTSRHPHFIKSGIHNMQTINRKQKISYRRYCRYTSNSILYVHAFIYIVILQGLGGLVFQAFNGLGMG
jgi:hypothetical protein